MKTLLFLLLITIVLFWQFFFKSFHPFPGNYLLAWFEPWKSETFIGSAPGIAHKAVADDTIRQLYPFRVLASDLVKKFEFPLWNPYNGAGQPLLATMHQGFLNPFGYVFLFFSSEIAWSLFVIFQAFLLGFATYLYCRQIGLGTHASYFASAVLLFSGFVVARYLYGEYLYVFLYLPLLLCLVERYLQGKKPETIYLLPLVIFLAWISGHPQAIFYVLTTALVYSIYRIWSLRDSESSKKTLFLLALFILGTGMASVQVLPTLELFRLANINLASSTFIFERFLLPVSQLISIVIPNYFGNQGTYNWWGKGDYVETAASIGLIPTFLALVGIFKKNKKYSSVAWFFTLVVLVSLVSTLDWFLPRFFSMLPIPMLSTGVPPRAFMLTSFALAILSGLGFDVWQGQRIGKKGWFLFLPFICGIVFLVAVTFLATVVSVPCPSEQVANCRTIALRNTILEVGVFSIFSIIFWLFLLLRNLRVRVFPCAVIGLLIFSGWYNSTKFLPFSPKETFYPTTEIIDALKRISGSNRVFGLGNATLKTNFATQLRFYDPQYYDPLYLRRYGELVSYANTGVYPPPLRRSDVEIVNERYPQKDVLDRRNRLLDLLSIHYLIYQKSSGNEEPRASDEASELEELVWNDKRWEIRQRKSALPRLYFVDSYEVIREPKRILERLFDDSFNPHKVVIIELYPKNLEESFRNASEMTQGSFGREPGSQNSFSSSTLSELSLESYEENRVSIQTLSSSQRLLIFTDNYYPGWKAFVDGRETPIFRANYTFRAAVIPGGKHTVTFIYDPWSLRLGLLLSVTSLFSYGTLLVAATRKSWVRLLPFLRKYHLF